MRKNYMEKIKLIQDQIHSKRSQESNVQKEKTYDYVIEKNLKVNLTLLKGIFHNNVDVIFREFRIGNDNINAFLVNIDGLFDKELVNNNVMRPLMWDSKKVDWQGDYSISNIAHSLVDFSEASEVDSMTQVVQAILSGDTALLVAGNEKALILGTRKWEQRGVNTPESESKVRGPREGLTETLRINTSLIRRKIKDPELMIEMLYLGDRTRTDIALVYIKDIANNELVNEVKTRMSDISIDAILESGYIESFIQDAPYSMFPTVGITESPDILAAKVLEGRVGIIVDGTPFALTAPLLFIEHMQSPEDYYTKPFLALQARLIRYFALHLALFLPGLYVAILTFHPHVFPISLLDTIAASQQGIPFPVLVETLLILIFFEGLREAGVRIPRPVGQAVSIVGALVLGDAVVSAGLASYSIVIIVAISGIMSFLLPPQLTPILLLRLPILLMGAIFGVLGVTWCYVMLIIYLVSLRSFGVPYLAPMMPYNTSDMKDVFVRVPWWQMKKRPTVLTPKNINRVDKARLPQSVRAAEGDKDEK